MKKFDKKKYPIYASFLNQLAKDLTKFYYSKLDKPFKIINKLKGKGYDPAEKSDDKFHGVNKFDVKTDSTSSVASSLSGGNLQKFVIGRELLQNPKLLIINQPTWGVDASAAAFIRQAIIDLAESGTAVVIISQDLDELIEVSDSFTALVGGRISDPQPMSGLKIRDIGQMMSGAMSYD